LASRILESLWTPGLEYSIYVYLWKFGDFLGDKICFG